MDPMTMMAIAQVGVATVQTVWNYFAGQDAIKQKKQRLTQQRDFQDKIITQQEVQGQKDIVAAAGSDAAGLAARGFDSGGFSDIAVTANTVDRTGKLTQAIGNARSELAMNFDNGMADINAASDQLNMDTLMGGLGVGLSAAGTLVDAGVFKEAAKLPKLEGPRGAPRTGFGSSPLPTLSGTKQLNAPKPLALTGMSRR